MGCIKHGLCILTDGKIHKTFYLAVFTQLCNINGIAVAGKEIDHFKHTFCDRSCLITEENV